MYTCTTPNFADKDTMYMLRQSLFALILSFLLLGAFSGTTAAQNDREAEIRQLLEQRDQQIKSILGNQQTLAPEQRAELKDLINGLIDFREMARLTLGPHWEELSTEQREEFIDVFSTIVRDHSLSNLDAYRAQVTFEEIDVSGDRAHVVTRTVYEGEPIRVEYDLIEKDDQWRATDIIIDEVSTVAGYERSFQSVIRKGSTVDEGFERLMQSLRKKRDAIETES